MDGRAPEQVAVMERSSLDLFLRSWVVILSEVARARQVLGVAEPPVRAGRSARGAQDTENARTKGKNENTLDFSRVFRAFGHGSKQLGVHSTPVTRRLPSDLAVRRRESVDLSC
jgi:hypothetical protein